MFPIGKVKSPNSQLGLHPVPQVIGGAEGEKPNGRHLPPEVPSPDSTVQGGQRFSETQMVPLSPHSPPRTY